MVIGLAIQMATAVNGILQSINMAMATAISVCIGKGIQPHATPSAQALAMLSLWKCHKFSADTILLNLIIYSFFENVL